MSAALGLLLLVVAGSAAAAGAHPLGNVTVNRYARVEVSAGVVRVYYVLDYAEIPAFQEGRAVAREGRSEYLRSAVEEIRRGLDLSIDGRATPLRAVRTGLDRPEGEADLRTLRVAAIFQARLPDGPSGATARLSFADRNEPGRLGWREIVIVARGDAELRSSTAPARDLSDELRSYPDNLIQAPLDLRAADATFAPGRVPVPAAALPRAGTPPNRSGDSLTELITRQRLDAGVVAGMLAVALAIGAGHAFLPGHGKTLMGAYLVGTKGRPVDAVLLGVIVSLMHTGSVLALGLLLYNVNRTISLDRLYPSLTVLSGCLAAAFGVFLLVSRMRRMRRARRAHVTGHHHDHHDHADHTQDEAHVDLGHGDVLEHGHGHEHAHDHDQHDHEHVPVPALVGAAVGHGHEPAATPPTADVPAGRRRGSAGFGHSHGPGHWHTHELPPDVPPFSRRGVVLLATSGGLVPSPSAVLVVVSAFSLGRVALGLTLVAAFSLGLAGTLTAIGLSLVFGRGFVERHWGRSLELLPVLGASAMVLAGLALALRGLLA